MCKNHVTLHVAAAPFLFRLRQHKAAAETVHTSGRMTEGVLNSILESSSNALPNTHLLRETMRKDKRNFGLHGPAKY